MWFTIFESCSIYFVYSKSYILSDQTRDQIATIRWIIEKAMEFQKNYSLWFINYAKAFDCVDHDKLWKALREMECQTILPVSWETCVWIKKQ